MTNKDAWDEVNKALAAHGPASFPCLTPKPALKPMPCDLKPLKVKIPNFPKQKFPDPKPAPKIKD